MSFSFQLIWNGKFFRALVKSLNKIMSLAGYVDRNSRFYGDFETSTDEIFFRKNTFIHIFGKVLNYMQYYY